MRAMILLLLLSGCVSRLDAGNAAGGVIRGPVTQMDETLQLADQHCARFGRTALLGGPIAPGRYQFTCVPK